MIATLLLPVTGSTAELGREAARRLARGELSRAPYAAARPPLPVRLVTAAFRAVAHAFASTSAHLPAGRPGLVLLLLLLVSAVAGLVVRLRPARTPDRAALLPSGGPLPPEEHRRQAQELAAGGAFAPAVRERLRAIAAELEERGVLDPRPGRTADELAADAGRRLPAVAADLRRATDLFDQVWYGGRPADQASYAVMVAVDRAVHEARLVRA